jgi:L-threonylcarbamoyladenylate synthase
MILYPTETLYAIGVNALDVQTLSELYVLKERDRNKPASWLVRNIEDIKKYAVVSPLAEKIARAFLPGSLTLVLNVKDEIDGEVLANDRTIGFRISEDPVAQELIESYMKNNDAPLTCTSANVSGAPTLPTVGEILQQFGRNAHMIHKVIDDGPRKGLASTVVRITNNSFTVLREGDITENDIYTKIGL